MQSQLTLSFFRAESVTKLTAICSTCHGTAAFFYKNNPDLGNQGSDLIGGADKYTATCRPCYRARPSPPSTKDNNNINKDVLNNATSALSEPKTASKPRITSRTAPSGLKVTSGHGSDSGPKAAPTAALSGPKAPSTAPKAALPGPKATPEPQGAPEPKATLPDLGTFSRPRVASGAPPKRVRFGPTAEDFQPRVFGPPPPSPTQRHPHLSPSEAESLEGGDISDDLLYLAAVSHSTTGDADTIHSPRSRSL